MWFPPTKERPIIKSLFAAGGGRFLAVVVLQFTARYNQHRSIQRHSQLGKPLELPSADAVGRRLGMAIRQLKKERLSLLNRSEPNHETKHETKRYQDSTPPASQAQQGNP